MTNMAGGWLQNIHTATKDATDAAERLLWLARSFEETGNEYVAKRLRAEASIIMKSASAISDAISDKVQEDVHYAEQSTVNVLSALLVGSELVERSKNQPGGG